MKKRKTVLVNYKSLIGQKKTKKFHAKGQKRESFDVSYSNSIGGLFFGLKFKKW